MCMWASYAENLAENELEGGNAYSDAVSTWANSIDGHRATQLGDWEYGACAIVSDDTTKKVYFTVKFLNCYKA